MARARASKPSRPRRGEAAVDASAVRTLAEVARHFGIAERTAANWRARGMPGKPGAYDLAAIAAWRDAQGLDRSPASNSGERLKRAEAELKELRLSRERRDLIRVEVAARLFRRHVHEARTQLAQLPDELAAELAAAVPRKRLAALRDRVRRRVDGACRALADLLAAEELEPAEEDGGQPRMKDEG